MSHNSASHRSRLAKTVSKIKSSICPTGFETQHRDIEAVIKLVIAQFPDHLVKIRLFAFPRHPDVARIQASDLAASGMQRSKASARQGLACDHNISNLILFLYPKIEQLEIRLRQVNCVKRRFCKWYIYKTGLSLYLRI